MLPFEPSNSARKTCPQTGFWVLPRNYRADFSFQVPNFRGSFLSI